MEGLDIKMRMGRKGWLDIKMKIGEGGWLDIKIRMDEVNKEYNSRV